MLPLVAIVVWLGGYSLAAGLALVAVLATGEVLELGRPLGATPMKAVSMAGSAILLADAVWPNHDLMRWCVLALPLGLLGVEVWHKNRSGSTLSWALGVAAPLYVGATLGIFYRLRASDDGLWWLILSLVGTWVADSAAYAIGVKLGRHKLAPSISPRKTWEGVWGELGGALLFVVPYSLLVLKVSWWGAVVLGVLLAAAAVIGDLAESVLKRQVGAKDSSSLIPGHGGMLDRIDSLLFVVPVVYVVRLLLVGL